VINHETAQRCQRDVLLWAKSRTLMVRVTQCITVQLATRKWDPGAIRQEYREGGRKRNRCAYG